MEPKIFKLISSLKKSLCGLQVPVIGHGSGKRFADEPRDNPDIG
jgi:hypothetical protein